MNKKKLYKLEFYGHLISITSASLALIFLIIFSVLDGTIFSAFIGPGNSIDTQSIILGIIFSVIPFAIGPLVFVLLLTVNIRKQSKILLILSLICILPFLFGSIAASFSHIFLAVAVVLLDILIIVGLILLVWNQNNNLLKRHSISGIISIFLPMPSFIFLFSYAEMAVGGSYNKTLMSVTLVLWLASSLAGIVFGLIGVIQKKHKKLLAVIGLSANLFVLALPFMFYALLWLHHLSETSS